MRHIFSGPSAGRTCSGFKTTPFTSRHPALVWLRAAAISTLMILAAVNAPNAVAATIVVSSNLDAAMPTALCTLRAAIQSMNAASTAGSGCVNSGAAFGTGDNIAFSAAVTLITLNDVANNSLNVTVNDLTISANPIVRITAAGAVVNAFRILNHTGTGQLTLVGLRIDNGRLLTDSQYGAGVFSLGHVSLVGSFVTSNETNCRFCSGAGVFGTLGVVVDDSVIENNRALGEYSAGGGVASYTGTVDIINSTIRNNNAAGLGGGIYSNMGAVTIRSSRINRNTADGDGGGLHSFSATSLLNNEFSENTSLHYGGAMHIIWATATVNQTTFSSNQAYQGGAIYFGPAPLNALHTIANSSFFSNNASGPLSPNAGIGGAIYGYGSVSLNDSTLSLNSAGLGGGIYMNGGALVLSSTIVSNSTSRSIASPANNVDIDNNLGILVVTGANNLVRVTSSVTMPAGTLTSDPLLGPLANNGCETVAGSSKDSTPAQCPNTALPALNSPVINAGSNTLSRLYDQRGAGFPRVLNAQADIGAIEQAAGGLVNGACGADSGLTLTASPVNLCTLGSASGVTASATSYDWSCNGSGGGTNATCAATRNYVVTTSVSGGNGSISASQTVAYNSAPSFTLTPNAGYAVSSVGGTCGGTLVGNTFTVNAVSAHCTVVAAFAPPSYLVSTSVSGGNGTISASQSVPYNATPSFTLTPNAGYTISSVGGSCGGSRVGNTFTTNPVVANCTVVATFALQVISSIPTLGQWTMAVLCFLIVGFGAGRIRRRAV